MSQRRVKPKQAGKLNKSQHSGKRIIRVRTDAVSRKADNLQADTAHGCEMMYGRKLILCKKPIVEVVDGKVAICADCRARINDMALTFLLEEREEAARKGRRLRATFPKLAVDLPQVSTIVQSSGTETPQEQAA